MLNDSDIKLRIKLFNYVDIQCNGKSIFKEKQLTAKLKSLLQYFVINKGLICKPEKIIEELWPENEYIERKKVLQTYIHRLRNALAKDNCFDMDFSKYISIVNNKGSYQMEISNEVEFDTETFMDLTRQVQSAADYDRIISLVNSINEVYDGNYLRDSHHEQLILRQQNYYLQTYCGAMATLFSKLMDLGKFEEVIKLCERFFVIEDLDDAINIIFMKALVNTQQVTYAVRHYNYIDKKMIETFDVHPSEEMTALYLSIKEAQGGVHAHAKESSLLDEDQIRNMVSAMIMERFKESQVKYSFAKIRILTDSNVDTPDTMVSNVLVSALRKNDMFTQIDEDTAMALLYEAKEEHFSTIIGRINKVVKDNYANLNAEVDIEIWPVTNII